MASDSDRSRLQWSPTQTGRKYALLLIPPQDAGVSSDASSYVCRAVISSDIESAAVSLQCALKRRLFGEAYELMLSQGYDVSASRMVSTVAHQSDVCVALLYPNRRDQHSLASWYSRRASRSGLDSAKNVEAGPTVLYGSKSQISLGKASDNNPRLEYHDAVKMAESLFHMAEIASLG